MRARHELNVDRPTARHCSRADIYVSLVEMSDLTATTLPVDLLLLVLYSHVLVTHSLHALSVSD